MSESTESTRKSPNAAAQETPAVLASEQVTPEPVEVTPLGLGLSLAGSAAILVGLFLPLADSSSFSQVAQNKLIQHSEAWGLVILAGLIAYTAYRAHKRKRSNWGPTIFGAWALGMAVYLGQSSDLLTLCSTTVYGVCERASAGVGIYAVGLGGLLGIIGGLVIKASKPATESASAPPDAPPPATAQETKQCPECAETILAAAKVCKHCGFRFENGEAASTTT